MGKVSRPHGNGGLVRVYSYADSMDTFVEAGSVFIRAASGIFREHGILSVAPHKNVLLMRLEGITSVDEAEACRGAELFVAKSATGREPGEMFWYELLGLRVHLDTGEYVGRVVHIIPTGANDVYVVKEGDREVLLPATHEVVKEIDVERGVMIVSPMEGLLELNEV